MRLSHSFHVSSGKQSLHKIKDVQSVTNHNHRKFKNSNNTNLDLRKTKNNIILRGTDNIMFDLKNLYDKEFSEAILQYNLKQSRKDRLIDNYFNKISDHKQKHLAEEIIIQFGNKDDFGLLFSATDIPTEYNQHLIYAFDEYLDTLENLLPNFKIANAVIHFDESTPHVHVVGVPIKEGGINGPSKQVSKNKVFSKDSLSDLQSSLGQNMREVLKKNLSLDIKVEKKEGRNKNFNTQEITDYKKTINTLETQVNNLYNKKLAEEKQLIDLNNLSINHLEEILAEKKRKKFQDRGKLTR